MTKFPLKGKKIPLITFSGKLVGRSKVEKSALLEKNGELFEP